MPIRLKVEYTRDIIIDNYDVDNRFKYKLSAAELCLLNCAQSFERIQRLRMRLKCPVFVVYTTHDAELIQDHRAELVEI